MSAADSTILARLNAGRLFQTYKRYRTLQTHRITSLPIAVLMPHSACNCRCVMCDIWKDNRNLKQLTETDIRGLLDTFRQLGTRQVLMSGGEALLNPNFFRFCEILKSHGLRISLLSTGLVLKQHKENVLRWVDDIIISLDGDEALHDQIRNVPGAFKKLKEGVQELKAIKPDYRITARTVIHRLNFKHWPEIIESALSIGLDQISFLPADVQSHAFNRQQAWGYERQQEICIAQNDLAELESIIDRLLIDYDSLFASGFIAESPAKLRHIHGYYRALHGLQEFPYKKCNAPWVSAVVEADGTVRPCFFHEGIGNIRENSLESVLNSETAYRFRKTLSIDDNPTCKQCVCYLNLPPGANIN